MAAAGSSSRLVSAAAAADGATSSCRSQAETGTDNIYGGVVAAAAAPAAVAPTCGGKTSWFGLGYGHAVGMCVAGVEAVALLLQQWGDAIG